MKIFHREFIQFLNKVFICPLLGHEMKWLEQYWAPGHSSGHSEHTCLRCWYKNRFAVGEMFVGKEKIREAKEFNLKEWNERNNNFIEECIVNEKCK